MPPRIPLLALVGALLVGCGQEQARRAEAARVVEAIDALIMADRKAKQPLLATLRAVPCTLPDVCEARQACADAFVPVVEAAQLQTEARALLDQHSPDLAAQVDAKLTQAEERQKLAHKLQERCISATTNLRQQYKL